jgi:hypothetical protein
MCLFLLPRIETARYRRSSIRDGKTMNSEMHEAGHLTALGWTMFALYLVAALLSFRAAAAFIRSQSLVVSSQWSSQTGRIWIWLGVILTALGLNKPINLQTLLIELGRQIAGEENLSTHRAGLHVLFFLAFVLAMIALLAVVMFRFRLAVAKFARQLPLAAGGCVLICIYILIRVASIGRVDLMLGFDLEHVPFLWLLEASGLLLIIAQALRGPDKKLKC